MYIMHLLKEEMLSILFLLSPAPQHCNAHFFAKQPLPNSGFKENLEGYRAKQKAKNYKLISQVSPA